MNRQNAIYTYTLVKTAHYNRQQAYQNYLLTKEAFAPQWMQKGLNTVKNMSKNLKNEIVQTGGQIPYSSTGRTLQGGGGARTVGLQYMNNPVYRSNANQLMGTGLLNKATEIGNNPKVLGFMENLIM